MLENLTFIDKINLKIATAHLNKKIYFVKSYHCPETGEPIVSSQYDSYFHDGIKPAILADDITSLEYAYEFNSMNNLISYDEFSSYSLNIIPDYINNHIELNKAINKLIDSDEKKDLFINQLKTLINSSHLFDLLNATNLQKAISLYNIL